jgi:hypothetical protein
MRFNYKNNWSFNYKFGRNPKDRSIEELHQLYLDLYSRHLKKREKVLKVISRIEKELPEANIYSNTQTRVLYKEKGGKVYRRVLSYNTEYKCWGVGTWDEMRFNKSVGQNRDDILDLLFSCSKHFELGALYDAYQGDDKYLYRIPWTALCEKVSDRLREKFKDEVAPEYLTITIGDRNYIVHCDDQSRYSRFYKTFTLKNEVNHVDI